MEFSGRIKADAIVLPNNTNPVVANRLRSDGSRLKYANDLSIEKDVAFLEDINDPPILSYTHTSNKEIYFESLDYSTGIAVTTAPHGIPTSGYTRAYAFSNILLNQDIKKGGLS